MKCASNDFAFFACVILYVNTSMKKQIRLQNIFWILPAFFVIGLSAIFTFPSIATAAWPADCTVSRSSPYNRVDCTSAITIAEMQRIGVPLRATDMMSCAKPCSVAGGTIVTNGEGINDIVIACVNAKEGASCADSAGKTLSLYKKSETPPSFELPAPTPLSSLPAECQSNLGGGRYLCSSDAPIESQVLPNVPIPIQGAEDLGTCIPACGEAGGSVLTNGKGGINGMRTSCYNATKPLACTITFSDARLSLNLSTGETTTLPAEECKDMWCSIKNGFKNLPILLLFGLPVALIASMIWIVGAIASLVSGILGGLLKIVIIATLNIKVVPGATGIHAIEAGWMFTRDLVNLLFLLFAVFVGLATILRLENYQLKKTLPKLLIAALLVNFSGVLVGIVVDFSNLLTKFFIDRIGTFGGMGTNVINSTKTFGAMLWALIGNLGLDPSTYMGEIIEPIGSLAVMAIFYAILLLALFVVMIVFVVRVAILWILTIMAPFAFASYAIPGMKKFWDDWLKTLISWSIIGIPLGFFLYISSSLVANLLDVSALLPVQAGEGEGLAGVLKGILGPATVAAILIYGLNFSLKMAPAGAQGLIKWGKTLGLGAAGFVGGAALMRTKARLAISQPWQDRMNRLATSRTPGTGMPGMRGVLARMTNPFMSVARWTGRSMGQGLVDSQKQAVGASDKSAAGKSMTTQASLFRSASNDASRIGIIQAMANDQNLDGAIAAGHVTPAEISRLFAPAAAYGTVGGLRNALPHIAAPYATPDAATIVRAGTLGPVGVPDHMLDVFQRIRPSNYKSMSNQVLTSPDFLNTLIFAGTGSHLHEFIDRFGLAGRDEIETRLNALSGGTSTRTYLQTHNQPLVNYIDRGAGTGVGVRLT